MPNAESPHLACVHDRLPEPQLQQLHRADGSLAVVVGAGKQLSPQHIPEHTDVTWHKACDTVSPGTKADTGSSPSLPPSLPSPLTCTPV